MKVIHVMITMEFGGIERLVFDLCREQLKKGFEVGVMVCSKHGQMAKLYELNGIQIIDAGLKNGFDPGWLNSANFIRILKATDIIHIHAYNPTIAKWAKRTGNPIIYTVHGLFGFGRRHTWRDRILFRMRSQFVKKYVNYITFNSCFTQKVAKSYFDIASVPGSIIYNGIDFDRFDKIVAAPPDISHTTSERPFVVGTTSRFAGVKRIDWLIKAFAGMQHRQHCRLMLVGDGPLRQSYAILAESLGITEQVEFTGYKQDVQNYQLKMDVCVFPSRNEAFGLVALETLALGKPTIVMRDGGGLIEIIEPIEPENIVSDVAKLSQRLDECFVIWKNKAEGNVKRNNRMAHARTFSIDRMTCDFDNIYSSIMN